MTLHPGIKALTFDLFGTVLDLGSSLRPHIAAFLKAKGAAVSPDLFWDRWRARQRIEQFQDTILMLGHSGYLETARRALVYSLAFSGVQATALEVEGIMGGWQELSPFVDVLEALDRLEERYRLVVLSNGDASFLDHLVKNRLHRDFDTVISVSSIGAFKPHPAVYRRAAGILGLDPGACMMVSANSFDIVGARSCGFRGAFVDRYGLPYEDSPYRPDLTVGDFTELAEALV